MDVEDLVREGADEFRREQTHVSGEADQVHIFLAQSLDHLGVVLLAGFALRWDHTRVEAALLGSGDAGNIFFIGNNDRDLGVGDAACVNGIGNSEEVGSAAGEEDAEFAFFIHHGGTEHTEKTKSFKKRTLDPSTRATAALTRDDKRKNQPQGPSLRSE